ncbi:MAG TPA: bifunctional serine/threonine-protein kinase/formylglycine-generating enzyme family protein [Anaerolineae bacterium]|nr:bifunctional serine/threonine-protein kinase/formylglycine-generating enzyme family protein [Anaerolineae bacterium]
MTLNPGQVLQNRYRIVAPLGQGGMGAVYRAWDLRLEGAVAVKEMVPPPGLDAATVQQLQEQFKREAVVLRHLHHTHLVRVIDFFEEMGNTYLVMDFVEGETLDAYIARRGALPETEVLAWAMQLLDALDYCHRQGVIHRDIKPKNVILRPDGSAVLVDFGLVKVWNPTDVQTQTVLRGMGSPEYAPPEQYGRLGQHTDLRSDLYSLGATLYHALTGQAPPTATDRMAMPEIFVPVRKINAHVSARAEAAILRAMALPRDQRFGSAIEMAAALRSQTGSVRGKRFPVWGWGLLVALLVLGSLGGWLALRAMTTPTPVVPTPTATLFPTPMVILPHATATPSPQPPATPTSQPTATPTITIIQPPTLGDTWTRPIDGMVMVYVPAGEFEMGSEDGEADEKPVHTVALDAFWIDQMEVSVAQFRRFVAATGHRTTAEIEGSGWTYVTGNEIWKGVNGADWRHPFGPGSDAPDNDPVTMVSWDDALAYCQWVGGRLPTEAEWEYAARGLEGRLYPWGNAFYGDRLNYCDAGCTFSWKDTAYNDGYKLLAPVGSYPTGVSWCGALDMAGNVWEWTADWYGRYPATRQKNPTGPVTGTEKILRGGGWDDYRQYLRMPHRYWLLPTYRLVFVGIRCAATDFQGP